MKSRLLKHLHNNNILCREEYGFWIKLTMKNATHKLMNTILNVLNNKLIVGGIFCGLERAFDCVNHDRLTSKLETYGITGIDKELYQSYLKVRYQRVLMYNKKPHYSTLSTWTLINHGVTQDSILGPLLFLLYINDFPQFANNKSTPMLFVDDISIPFTYSNTTELNSNIHTVFEIIHTWFKNNYCSLNFEKFTVFTLTLEIIQQLT
jgi:Reverse transcriptase (RNA-dependent DNA polymerase).